MKKQDAIKLARQRVGKLFQFGAGNYRFNWYDPAVNASRESTPRTYDSALYHHAQKLIDIARDAQDLEPVQYDGGAWIDYV